MRPRQFQEDELLALAFDSFWRKGVRGTSLADIAREAGMQRGSLYNAYGSKEALFLKAYERYSLDYIATIAATLSEGPLRQRLERFFDAAIRNFAVGHPPRGCPTTRGLMELSSEPGHGLPEATRNAFAALLTRVQNELRTAFEAGYDTGDFKGDPTLASEHVLTVARGLVVLERAYQNEGQLRRIAANTIDLVLSASARR